MATSDKAAEAVKEYLAEAYNSARKWRLPNGSSWQDNSNSKVQLTQTAGVIGGGTMGRGIAIALVRAGLDRVVLVENSEKELANCKRELHVVVERELAKGRFSQAIAKKLQAKLHLTTNLDELSTVDLVIEAIFEDMKMKRELFAKLDRICKPETILATNTSSLDIDRIASSISQPDRVIGIHFFNPAHVVRTIEIVHGNATSGEAVAIAFDISYKMKKVPVLVKNYPGFLFNRLLHVYLKQSQQLMSTYGMYPHQVDAIFTSFGLAMGPITTADMNGLDVAHRVSNEQGWKMDPLPIELIKLGRFGRKTGSGYYKYLKGGKKVPDEVVEQMIDRMCKAQPNKLLSLNGTEAVLQFALYPMINEGFHCVDRAIVNTVLEIDLMFVFGLGWPIHTGGPMRWGKTIGYGKIASRLMEMWHLSGDEVFKPAVGLLKACGQTAKL